MDNFELYIKTFLLSKNVKVDGLSTDEMIGASIHLGGPAMSLEQWGAVMGGGDDAAQPEDQNGDDVSCALNKVALINAMGDKVLQDKGILKIEKVA